MRKVRAVLFVAVGGAIVGGLTGVGVGALGGVVYGLFRGDVSLGLDGALLFGGILAALGAGYGAVLELTDEHRRRPRPQRPAAAPREPASVSTSR